MFQLVFNTPSHPTPNQANKILTIPLKGQIKPKILFKGTVTSLPNEIFKNSFYLDTGYEVYNKSNDFPEIHLGSELTINGKLSNSKTKKRILISNKKSITVNKNTTLKIPEIVKIAEVDDDLLGKLIHIKGQIIEKDSNKIYIDDKSNELIIYTKNKNQKPKNLQEGDIISVIGILTKTNNEFRLRPRNTHDFKMIKKNLKELNPDTTEINNTDILEKYDFKNLFFISIIINILMIIKIIQLTKQNS